MNKYFCKAPFTQLEFSPQGECRVCCKISKETVLDDEGNQFNLQTTTISEVWKSKWMNDFRQRNINEEKRPECQVCWDDEEAGIVSFRKQLNHLPCNVENPQMIEMVLKLSNKCNCACRICCWYLSSLWQTELEKTGRFSLEETPGAVNNIANKITDYNWEDWKKNLEEIHHLSLYGGEPLINEEVLRILQYLIDIGRSPYVEIGLNTNATVTSDRMFTMLNKFKDVNLHFSIDDLEKRYDYERWPAKSENIFPELKKLHDINKQKYPKITINLYTTISVFNILNLGDLLEKFKEYPNWIVNFDNIAYTPSCLSIFSLPEEIKPKIEEYLNTINWAQNNWLRPEISNKDNIINFMYLYKSPYSCKEYIKTLDKELGFDDLRRKQDWRKTFVKLYDLLQNTK